MPRENRNRVLYYGSRKSNKLVRCYKKVELGVYRVEVEFHSGLLSRHAISTLDDFIHLPKEIYPNHFQLVAPDWNRLTQYLAGKFGDKANPIVAEAHLRTASMRRLRRYLRAKGVVNLHRFFRPLAADNREVIRALNRWASDFSN